MKKLARLTAVVVGVVLSIGASGSPQKADNKRSLSLNVIPVLAVAPVRITAFAQLKGDVGDKRDYYCPTIEWDWDDGTISQSSHDCEPFVPNRSDIEKSFTESHVYTSGGSYAITIKLKKGERVVVTGLAAVTVE